MKLRAREMDEEVEIDMSPMIDMVFLLLIFFIVASKIIADKPKVAIPEAKQVSISKEDAVDADKRFMISVSKEDVDRRYYLPGSAEDPVTFEELVVGISQAVNADPEIKILIRADSEVPFKVSEKIMRACAEAGAFNLIFAAREETD